MFWSQDCEEILKIAQEMLGKKIESQSYFVQGECNFNAILDTIECRILKEKKC